jgi:hypothetical protein
VDQAPPKAEVFGWCRVRGDGCRLAPAHQPQAPGNGSKVSDGGRRAKVVVDGAVVHFRAYGYMVTEKHAQIVSSSTLFSCWHMLSYQRMFQIRV